MLVNEEMKKHFDLNSTDYDIWMGSASNGMMRYGDHSNYSRDLKEKILSKTGLISRKEVQQSVVYRVKSLAEKADIKEGDTVVDSGCGRGGNAIWLAQNTDAEKVIGLDIDEDLLEKARENAEESGVGESIEFIQQDFDNLSLDDFDVYFAIESQCYSKNEKELLENIYEKLNPGGRVVISDGFRTDKFSEKHSEISRKMHIGWGVDYMAYKSDFERFLREVGFQNIDAKPLMDRIGPTSKYLYRASMITTPYVDLRLSFAKARETAALEAGFKTMIENLVEDAQKIALKAEDPQAFRDTVKEYARNAKNFRPSVYSSQINEERTVFNVLDGHRMSIVSHYLETCLSRQDGAQEKIAIDGEEFTAYDRRSDPIKEATDMYERDPFTFVQVFGEDKEPDGYVRSYVLEDKEGKIFLGIDTIEIPENHDQGNYEEVFSEFPDLVSTGSLAAIKLGEDLGVDYVAGTEARMAHGPRQANSNASRREKYRKLGDPVPYYSVYREGDRVRPGFAGPSSPKEEEVRGFNTMPGWHETELKTLIEFG